MGVGPHEAAALDIPGRPRASLLRSVRVIEGDGRWINGVEIESLACQPGDVQDPCDVDAMVTSASEPFLAEPYKVRVDYTCSPGRSNDFEAKARALLTRNESRLIAAEFESGTAISGNPFLNDANAVDLGTGSSPLEALELLEGHLADCGNGDGVIHAPFEVVTRWAATNALIRDAGGQVLTYNGILVVSDAGYTGDPSGDSRTAFATGPVTVYLGEVMILDGIDRELNTRSVVAERPGLAVWDGCCQAKVVVPASA